MFSGAGVSSRKKFPKPEPLQKLKQDGSETLPNTGTNTNRVIKCLLCTGKCNNMFFLSFQKWINNGGVRADGSVHASCRQHN